MSLDAYKMYINKCMSQGKLKKASVGYKEWKEMSNGLETSDNAVGSKQS